MVNQRAEYEVWDIRVSISCYYHHLHVHVYIV